MGQALVDNAHSPTVFKLEVGSFRYFAGNAASVEGNSLLDSLRPYTFLMPSAPGWAEAAQDKYQGRLITINRFRFSSEPLAAEHLHRLINQSDLSYEVKLMDVDFAQQFWERDHFIHLSDYESP